MSLPFKLRRTRFKCVDDEVSGRTRSEIGEPPFHVPGTTNLYSQATVPMAAFLGPRPNIRHRYDVIDTLHGAPRHIGVPMSPLASSIACSRLCPTTVRLINETVISVYACDEPSISLLNGLAEFHATILRESPMCGNAPGSAAPVAVQVIEPVSRNSKMGFQESSHLVVGVFVPVRQRKALGRRSGPGEKPLGRTQGPPR